MVRDAARRLLARTGLIDAQPGPSPEKQAGPRAARPEDEYGAVSTNHDSEPDRHPEEARSAVSKDGPPTMGGETQDVMAQDVTMGEHRPEYRPDYFDFAPEPPPETEGVERPEGEDDPDLLEPVLDALRTVHDPEIPVNIVELGLIYELVVKQGGLVYVEMTLTTPACPVAQSMPGEVENAVASVPGVSEVRVKLVWTPPWDRDRMSEEAKLELGLL